MRFALWLLMAVSWMGACASGSAGNDDAIVDTDGDGLPDPAVPDANGVSCPNPLRPAKTLQCEGETPVCCLGGALGITPRCAATLGACGQDSRLACDGANDCGDGQACCIFEQGGGQKTTLVGQCKDRCTLLEKQSCNGAGTCKGDKLCCQLEGDVWGECLASCEGYGDSGR